MPPGAKARTVRRYDPVTIKLLWGRAGWRCAMPNCRVELYAEATDYDPVCVIGEMAHVAGASDDGPRARKDLTATQRNDYKNLILLCQNCHGKVDGQPGYYTEKMLFEIKQAHEAWVRASLPERGRSRIGWTAVLLEGDQPVDLATADEAISPDFIAGSPHLLKVPTRPVEWQSVDRLIAQDVGRLLSAGDTFDHRIAVFPLAPVSACLALGYHLTSRPHVRHFQLHRDSHSWAWPKRQAPAEDIEVAELVEDPDADQVAFFFHFSATITELTVREVLNISMPRVHVRVPLPRVDWLVHPQQVALASLAARQVFQKAMAKFPNAKLWHLFYAGPAPIGVTIGQQINPTMCPPVQLYEFILRDNPPYKASIVLGG